MGQTINMTTSLSSMNNSGGETWDEEAKEENHEHIKIKMLEQTRAWQSEEIRESERLSSMTMSKLIKIIFMAQEGRIAMYRMFEV